MVKWMAEFKEITEMKEKLKNNCNRIKGEYSTKHPSENKCSKEEIHLITIVFSDNGQQIKNLFRKNEEQVDIVEEQELDVLAETFFNHCYSFQGIYNYNPKNSFQNYSTIFIKLRDPRGQSMARIWRNAWSKKQKSVQVN